MTSYIVTPSFCRHCGEALRNGKELQAHVAVRHPTPTSAVLRTNITTNSNIYCDVCEREFTHEGALQMHISNSKVHKRDKRRLLLSADARETTKTLVPTTDSTGNGTRNTTESFQHGNNYWSKIPDSQQAVALAALEACLNLTQDLQKHQYLLRPYSAEDIAGLRRCMNCDGTFQLSDEQQYI
jgi:hypothetical protein